MEKADFALLLSLLFLEYAEVTLVPNLFRYWLFFTFQYWTDWMLESPAFQYYKFYTMRGSSVWVEKQLSGCSATQQGIA
jgi:hypothetical protein